MLGFCVLAPFGDSLAKLLGGQVNLWLLLMTRFIIQAAIMGPLALATGVSLAPPRHALLMMWLRAALHVAGIGLMFSALRYLPIADALAIAFVMPFIMLLLGHLVLGETVGRQRIIACGVGFIGTLLVIQPNFVEVGWPALLPLAVAVVFSLFMLVTRKIAKDIDPLALQAINGVQGTVLILPIGLAFPALLSFDQITPTTGALMLAMGVIGTAAHLLMSWSLRFAPSATLAPMQYLEIPMGTLLGYLIFKDLPNGLAALGICITIAAGLYIILREGRLSQRPENA